MIHHVYINCYIETIALVLNITLIIEGASLESVVSFIGHFSTYFFCNSHCWNPKCGRWAYKIDVPPLLNKVEHCVETDFCMDTIINSINNTDGYVTQTIGVEAGSSTPKDLRISRMKMCSRCRKAKYCSKLCQVFDWRSGKHKRECTMT